MQMETEQKPLKTHIRVCHAPGKHQYKQYPRCYYVPLNDNIERKAQNIKKISNTTDNKKIPIITTNLEKNPKSNNINEIKKNSEENDKNESIKTIKHEYNSMEQNEKIENKKNNNSESSSIYSLKEKSKGSSDFDKKKVKKESDDRQDEKVEKEKDEKENKKQIKKEINNEDFNSDNSNVTSSNYTFSDQILESKREMSRSLESLFDDEIKSDASSSISNNKKAKRSKSSTGLSKSINNDGEEKKIKRSSQKSGVIENNHNSNEEKEKSNTNRNKTTNESLQKMAKHVMKKKKLGEKLTESELVLYNRIQKKTKIRKKQ